jgi:hypothetical protein
MQIIHNIKKSVVVAKVFLSIKNSKIYVAVADIAIFLNVLFGTHTITGQKVNEMLKATYYQRPKSEAELQRDELIDIKYMPLLKAENLFEVDTIVKNNIEINRLLWNGRILLDIFQIDLEKENYEILDNFCSIAYEYNLINTSKEDINNEVLEENIGYLIEELRKVSRNE